MLVEKKKHFNNICIDIIFEIMLVLYLKLIFKDYTYKIEQLLFFVINKTPVWLNHNTRLKTRNRDTRIYLILFFENVHPYKIS